MQHKTPKGMNSKKDMEAAFKAADANNDGQLDLDEYISHFARMNVNMSREDGKTLFLDKDRDGDNAISIQEFKGEMTPSEAAWSALNPEKNACLTRQQLKEGLKKYKRSITRCLSMDEPTILQR